MIKSSIVKLSSGIRFSSRSLSRLVNQPNILDDECSVSRMSEKIVHVITSVGRWKEKPSGLDFDVSYLDIYPRCMPEATRKSAPVILYLTGYISNHKPVKHFLLKLADHTNCRVVAPLWPGLCDASQGRSTHDSDFFGHTVGEYAELAVNFLSATNIIPKKQPLVSIVAHSGGCHAALFLGSRMSHITKSFVLLSPSAPRPLSKFGYEWLHRFVAKSWENKSTRVIVRPVIAAGVYFSPFRGFLSTDEAAALAQATLRVQRDAIMEAALDVTKRQIPLLLVYSDYDEWIPLADSLAIAGCLNLHPHSKPGRASTQRVEIIKGVAKQICDVPHTIDTIYDNAYMPRQAIRIVKGGNHWPQRKCPDLVLQRISQMIDYCNRTY